MSAHREGGRPGLPPLPIDPLLARIVAAVRDEGVVVIQAPPGAGKTTRVPRALLDAGLAEGGHVIVLQPRRLATRLAAERVAAELGEASGRTVGYSVRFEQRVSPDMRLHFMTEGVLLRRLMDEPTLPGVAVVILDEFHERHLASDLVLGLLRQLRRSHRPDLGIVVMSATLDADPVAAFLDEGQILTSQGRSFPIGIQHAAPAAGQARAAPRLHDEVARAVRLALQEEEQTGPQNGDGAGDILVFLPGAGEIRRAQEALQPLATRANLLLLPLHGDLPLAEQDRAVRPADRRKVILSTNVAETSVTIDGVVTVIDSGLARMAVHSPWTGLPTVNIGKISQASAAQRAGRAGRTRPGKAIRLYGQHDHDTRPLHDVPEVARLDLADALLSLHALGVTRPADWDWFETPPPAALAAATTLLQKLAAIDARGQITAIGRRLLRYPVHPRLARLMDEGARLGVGDAAAVTAALLSERDVRSSARVRFDGDRAAAPPPSDDLLDLLYRFEQTRGGRGRGGSDAARSMDLDPRAVESANRVARQLEKLVPRKHEAAFGPAPQDANARDQALARAVLAGFPDRVARRRGDTGEVVLCGGGSASVGPTPAADLMVVVDAAERDTRRGAGPRVAARLVVPIESEWLLEVDPDAIEEKVELAFSEKTQRVEESRYTTYGQVVLEEMRRAASPSPAAGALLLAAARDAGPRAWSTGDEDAVAGLIARVALLRATLGDDAISAFDDGALLAQVPDALPDATSFADLRAANLPALWQASLPSSAQSLLGKLPARVRLPGGRDVPVHYEIDKPPWIESRLQDFFGMQQGPQLLDGRVPLTLHLLAPNRRALQVTRDLAGFWTTHYPPLRKQLSRRYPRHDWPEDGATAKPSPPAPRKPRP